MAREIVDRERELTQLRELAKRPPALVVLRGRRRVGKTFLLRVAFPNERVVSLQAEEQPRAFQLEAFARECSRLLPGTPPLAFESWSNALEFIERQASAAHPLVVILDEFQYLVTSEPALPSIVQRVWDRWDERETPVTLVLSGSALSFMEGLLGGAQPTFGRSVYRPLLAPLSYRDARAFAPAGSSPAQWIERFAVLGGTPQYQLWAGRKSLSEVIAQAILPPDSPLHGEPEHLIREEEGIRGPGPYFGALEAIAHGYTTTTAIGGRLEMSAQLVNKFLRRLEELSYLARVDPIEVDGPAVGRGHWKISDPYFRFWFRFVFPNRSRLARGRVEEVAREIQRDLSTCVGPLFEDCCREWVGRHSDLGAGALEVGSWWSRKGDVEVDLVTREKKGYGLLGSCKWSTRQLQEGVLDELLQARAAVGPKAAQAKLAVFARAGFSNALKARAKRDRVSLVQVDELF